MIDIIEKTAYFCINQYNHIMKHLRLFAALVLLSFVSTGAMAQSNLLNNLARRAKQNVETRINQGVSKTVNKALEQASENVENAARNGGSANAGQSALKASKNPFYNSGEKFYVSASGSNKNTGRTPDSPYKNLQKAIDEAKDGAVIYVAEGNYLGTLNQGYIDVNKYVSIVGGYKSDFSARDPYAFPSYIQTSPDNVSTNGTKALMNINVTGSRTNTVLIDGFGFDLGYQNLYATPDTKDPRNGCPEGCETGRICAVGEGLGASGSTGGAAQAHQLMHGVFEGHLVVRNCVFANGVYYGIQMMSKGGSWEIYNNVFCANSYASCQVDSMTKDANQCYVDFHHNTVLFTWCRTKVMEDMGYGFRLMSRVDCDVHDNIFGCSNLGAMDYTHHDSNKAIDALRKIRINNNQFFMNKADLILPSKSFMWLYVMSGDFDDVEEFEQLDGNVELSDQNFANKISAPYLKGFAQIEKMASSSFDRNSAANLYRQAHGLNMQGTEIVRVSMYGNRYPFNETYKLFGALRGAGAQATYVTD